MVDTSEFVTLLAESHLVEPELLDRLRARIAKHGGKVDPRSIAKWLVDKGHLSLWQTQQLLAGHNAFFLGRYRLIDRIGKGGMGVVFKAQHAVMDRTVALKVMSHRLLNNRRAVARFEREVKTLSALNHKNIITAHDADRVGSTHFLVMEYVDGCDLNRWLRSIGPLPVSAAAEFIMQTAEGLRHATRRKLVHRDIKPVNLLLTWDQEEDRPVVKILDMGLARFISETQEDGGITRVGQLIGTPDYIAPEAAKNFTEADIRADIFSLGCACFRLLTGRLPFAGNNAMEKLMARATEDAPDVRSLRPDVPAELAAVVAKMLARAVDDRYQTPDELIKAIKPFTASKLGDTATLQMFRDPPTASSEDSDVDADADTSFEEFYRDFSVSPKSDAPSAPDEPPRPEKKKDEEGSELGLALSEDDEDEDEKLSLGVALNESDEPAVDADSPLSDDESSVDEEVVVGTEMLAADNMTTDIDHESQAVQGLAARRSGWDSPLMLVGGGMLVLLIALGGFLWWQLNRDSGDAMLQQAEDKYEASDYGQAIDSFDRYLERFPDHKDNSIARVHRGLAQIRQAVESSNWPRALEVTNGVLDEISSQEAFGEARNELAAVLPKISTGLAEQAREQPTAKLITSARSALALVDKYVIKSLRPAEQLEETSALLARAERDLGRDNALAEAVTSINQSVAAGDTDTAYAARRQLLRDYPDLQDNGALSTAVLTISASMKDAIVASDESRDAVVDQPAPPFAAKAILSALDPSSEQTSAKSPVAALVHGSVFGLDGRSGGVLWHRFVGIGSTAAPITLTDSAAGDFLVVDSHHNELVRLDGRTGEARWRQPLDASTGPEASETGAFEAGVIETALAVFGRHVTTADTAGALTLYDLDTGKLVRRVMLPQSLRIAPTVSSDRATVYAVGEHSNLFVIGTQTGECHEVHYLGHEPGTIRIPPLVMGRYVVVAENYRLDDSRLRILLASEDGTSLSEIQQVELQGHVTTAPVISGNTLFVVTDQHGINVFEVQPLGNDDPFTKVLSRPPSSEQHMLRFASIADGQLLVAGEQLTMYDVRAVGGRLPPKAVFFEGHRFLQPPRVDGDTVFLVHQPPGGAGAITTAMRGRDGESVWTSHIASPAVGLPFVDEAGSRLLATSANGSLFEVNLGDPSRSGVVSKTVARTRTSSAEGLWATAANVRIDAQRLVLGESSSHKRLLLCDLAGAEATLRWLNLPAPLGGPPCVMSEGIVAAGEIGQLFWLDAESGSPLATPFQTTLATGVKHRWHVAPLPHQDEDGLIVAGNAAMLYRLGVEMKAGSQPALVARAERELSAPITRGFAISGEAAFAVDDENRLLVVDSTSLDEIASHGLDAPVVWGPTAVGELVLIATDHSGVLAFTAAGNPAWTHASSGERLVGAAPQGNSNIVLGFDDGQLRVVNTENGETVAEVNLDRPLLQGPMMWQGRAVVTAPDGTIYAIDLP